MGIAESNCIDNSRMGGGHVHREGHAGCNDERSRIHIKIPLASGGAVVRSRIFECHQFTLNLKHISWLMIEAARLYDRKRVVDPENECCVS